MFGAYSFRMSARRRADAVPLLEWMAGGLAFIVVAGTLAFIGFETFRSERDGPDLRTEIGAVTQANGGHSVAVIVRNAGRRAAATVIVEGISGEDDGRGTRAEAQVDYVPGLSQAEATLIFPFPPDRASLRVRVIGFTVP